MTGPDERSDLPSDADAATGDEEVDDFTEEDSSGDEETHRGAFGEFAGDSTAFIDRSFRERIVLVGVALPHVDDEDVTANLDELARLVDTAGADEVARFVQRRQSPDPATYVGKGKVSEIRDMAVATDSASSSATRTVASMFEPVSPSGTGKTLRALTSSTCASRFATAARNAATRPAPSQVR